MPAPFDGTYKFTAYAQAGGIASGAQVGVNVAGSVVQALDVPNNAGYALYTIAFTARAGEVIRVWCGSNADTSNGWMTFDNCTPSVVPLAQPE